VNRLGQGFTSLLLPLVVLALGAALRSAEEVYGQQLHTALQNQCNSLEKSGLLIE